MTRRQARKTLCRHEAAHAVVAELVGATVERVTVKPTWWNVGSSRDDADPEKIGHLNCAIICLAGMVATGVKRDAELSEMLRGRRRPGVRFAETCAAIDAMCQAAPSAATAPPEPTARLMAGLTDVARATRHLIEGGYAVSEDDVFPFVGAGLAALELIQAHEWEIDMVAAALDADDEVSGEYVREIVAEGKARARGAAGSRTTQLQEQGR